MSIIGVTIVGFPYFTALVTARSPVFTPIPYGRDTVQSNPVLEVGYECCKFDGWMCV